MTTENNGMYMPVAPAYGGGYSDGMFGGNGAWWIIILLAVLGWGNGFGGNGMGGNAGGFFNADVQRGFDQSALTTGINGIQTALCNGFAGVNNGMATGFAGVNQAVANGFAQAEIAANSRQMAEMNQNFALQSSFQNCCCENRLATAGVQTAIAQEGANTRAASAANTQAILDKLCQLELDGVKQNYEGQLRAMQNQLALAIDGEIVPTSIAAATPAAVENYWNVSGFAIVDVPSCCCYTVSVENASVSATPATTPAPALNLRNLNVEVTRIA